MRKPKKNKDKRVNYLFLYTGAHRSFLSTSGMFSSLIDVLLAPLRYFFSSKEELDDEFEAAIRDVRAYCSENGVTVPPDAVNEVLDALRNYDC